MSVCFQLFAIGSDKGEPLNQVDEAICKHFGVEVHPTLYYHDWFDVIGFRLALGKTWDEIVEEHQQYIREIEQSVCIDDADSSALDTLAWYTRTIEIVGFLRERYSVNAWREIGRHH